MKKKVFVVSVFCFTLFTKAFSQAEKFDIATFIPPKNWQRIDSNGMLVFHDYKTNNNLTSFCQIVLYPSRTSSNDPSKNFEEEWNTRVTQPTGSKVKPTTQTEKTPDGWNIVTGYANITQSGLSYMRMLVTASGFGKTMSVMVNTAGSDHAPAIEKFFNDLDLDSNSTIAAGQQNNNSNSNQTNMSGTFNLNDYDFIAPEGWQLQKNKDHYLIQNMASGCLIRILDPQPSSGDLEQNAKAVFDLMYAGWQYQKSGEQKYDLSKGFLSKGLEYCMMEAGMGKLSSDGSRYDGFEAGAALVIKAGAQIVIISVRHNSSLMAHDDCYRKYETWRRFFNSFSIKNHELPGKTVSDPSGQIAGDWMAMGGGALNEYLFAANGNYQYIGAYSTTSKTTDAYYEYTHLKTSSFKGDGSYSINGNKLTLTKHGSNNKELVQFRLEKVNHGGTGWRDRLYMLQISTSDGKPFEVCYEKSIK